MPELVFIVLFFLWYILALVVSENLRTGRRPGTEWTFFFCMIFSPLVVYLILRLSVTKNHA